MAQKRLNLDSLQELFTNETSPQEVAEILREVNFAYSRLCIYLLSSSDTLIPCVGSEVVDQMYTINELAKTLEQIAQLNSN